MESQNLPEMSTLSPMSDKISKNLIHKSMVISTNKNIAHQSLQKGLVHGEDLIENHLLQSEVTKLKETIEDMKKDHIK